MLTSNLHQRLYMFKKNKPTNYRLNKVDEYDLFFVFKHSFFCCLLSLR